MQGDILDTIFALVFAVVVIAFFWTVIMYFSEMGSEEAKKEYKNLILNSVTALLFLMILFGIVAWVRGYIGI